MAAYTLIESQDPHGGDDFARRLAPALAEGGADVAVFFVDNGVFAARNGVASELLSRLTAAGVKLYADEFALSERGILGDDRAAEVTAANLDALVDQLAAGRKTLWH